MKDRRRDGGLEAHQGFSKRMCAVLPIAAYESCVYVDFVKADRHTLLRGHGLLRLRGREYLKIGMLCCKRMSSAIRREAICYYTPMSRQFRNVLISAI